MVQLIDEPAAIMTTSFDRLAQIWTRDGHRIGTLQQGGVKLPWLYRVENEKKILRMEQTAMQTLAKLKAEISAEEEQSLKQRLSGKISTSNPSSNRSSRRSSKRKSRHSSRRSKRQARKKSKSSTTPTPRRHDIGVPISKINTKRYVDPSLPGAAANFHGTLSRWHR